MTNSSPQPPVPPESNGEPQERRRRAILSFDEKIAVIVAFSTIGSILFWALAPRQEGFSFSNWRNGWLLTQDETEDTAVISSKTKDSKILLGKTEGETSELTSKYIGKQSQLPAEELDITTTSPIIERETTSPSNLAATGATIATGLILRKSGEIEFPSTEPEPQQPPATGETTPPETAEETPPTGETTPKVAFRDIPDSYWAYPFVEKLGEKELISGFSQDDIFEPEKLITRASMASLISQAFDLPANLQGKNFNDVSNQNALAADIRKAVQTGFMKGYSDNEFRPLENIPRYQVLVALATGLGLEPSQDADDILSQFNDADGIPDWAKQQVAAAAQAGLIVNPPGVNSNTLAPNKEATRAEVAAMIHQALVELNTLEPIDSQYIVEP